MAYLLPNNVVFGIKRKNKNRGQTTVSMAFKRRVLFKPWSVPYSLLYSLLCVCIPCVPYSLIKYRLTVLTPNIIMVSMYLRRSIEKTLDKAVKTFPAVVICGPRQSGKSTLFANYVKTAAASIISLDNPEYRRLLLDDPLHYLAGLPKPVVLDEIQYAPELTIYIKLLIDRDRMPGQWFITGSQQFNVMKNVSESLAGRAAVFSLPPFTIRERGNVKVIENFLLTSSYPEPAVNPDVDLELWYSSYLQTYIERDVRMLLNIVDLRDFEQFIRLLAAYTGQELKMSTLANRLGISVPTIKRWLSVLEASYIIFLLPPYFNNYGKRIIKSPKIYFYDIGLVNYLVGIKEISLLLNGPMAGAIFETAVVSEIMKNRLAKGSRPRLYFWRSQSGMEVDLIEQQGPHYVPLEIKLSSTIKPAFYKNISSWLELSGQHGVKGYLVTNCRDALPLPPHIENIFWGDL